MGLQVRTGVIFVAENGCSDSFCRVAAAFCVFGLLPPQDCPISMIRKPTEYFLSAGYGKPVRIRHNRPLLCWVQP